MKKVLLVVLLSLISVTVINAWSPKVRYCITSSGTVTTIQSSDGVQVTIYMELDGSAIMVFYVESENAGFRVGTKEDIPLIHSILKHYLKTGKCYYSRKTFY